MKKFSKIFAIMTMVALLLTSIVPVSVFAVTPSEPTGSITIKDPSYPSKNTIEGRDFSVYKIFNLTYNGAGAYSYTLAPEFVALANYNGLPNEAALVSFLETATVEDLDDFAQYIFTNFIENGTVSTPYTQTAGNGDTEVRIDNLPYGYYLVTGSINANGDVGQEVIASCGLNTVTDNIIITPKADAPTIEKKVWNKDIVFVDGIDNPIDPHWYDWTDLYINDFAEFRLLSKVPNMKGYETYTFIVHDTMSDGLEFNKSSVVITIGNQTLVEGIDYTITTIDEDPNIAPDTFQIEFIDFLQWRDGYTNSQIVIRYSARVTEEAVIGIPGNPNTVYLEYSNDPNWVGTGTPGEEPPTGETPPDEVKVYTYELDLNKFYMLNTAETPLAGAEFILYKNRNGSGTEQDPYQYSNPIKFTLNNTNVAENTYFVDDTGSEVVVSTATGMIYLKGLDAGRYYLVETKAPEGFNKLTSDFEIDVDLLVFAIDNSEAGKYEITYTYEGAYNQDALLGLDGCNNTIKIENRTGTLFPETGGVGRTMFILVGSTMLAVGLISLVVFRKKIFASK